MRVLIVINVLGVLAGAVFAGYAYAGNYVPRLALAAALTFLGALFWPFLREHLELRRGFDRVEEEFQTQKRRDLGMIRGEIFTNARRPSIWSRRRSILVPLVVMAGLGVALLFADVVTFVRHEAPAGRQDRIITNF